MLIRQHLDPNVTGGSTAGDYEGPLLGGIKVRCDSLA